MVKQIRIQNTNTLLKMVNDRNIILAKAMIEELLKNLNTRKKSIPLLDIKLIDEDEIFISTLEKQYFRETLVENLDVFLKAEEYELCRKIQDAINDLNK